MTHETRRVTYSGDRALAPILAQMIEHEGITVEWEQPLEQRSLGDVHDVMVKMVAAGNYDAIKAGVDKFLERIHATKADLRARVTIEDDEEPQR